MENRIVSPTITVKNQWTGLTLVYRVPCWPSGAPVAWQAEDKAKAALQSPMTWGPLPPLPSTSGRMNA
jgi:hypothetical protein